MVFIFLYNKNIYEYNINTIKLYYFININL